ncbi:transmembrane protein 179-like [Anneissia japonica]|uniref:transmembrane protein 179-like n=1 Tax=Anneissia japonica TaxID=1529436 RepID=UPI001425A56A|nr:transmembrane protein 179-like [Anneissia japonica]
MDTILLFVQAVLLAGAGLAGFAAAITIGLSRNSFGGNCILYAEANWYNTTVIYFKDLGNNSACQFCVSLQVVASLYALAYAAYTGYIILKNTELRFLVMPAIAINVLLVICIFIQACVVSVGFRRFCKSVKNDMNDKDCSQGSDIDWNTRAKPDGSVPHDNYDVGKYYQFLTSGQGASWASFLFWLAISILTIIRRIRDKTSTTLDPNSDKAPITDVVI